jgi:DNA-binding PucR family transcriptional regulator
MDSAPTDRTYELVAKVADRLAGEIDEIVAAMDVATREAVPALAGDAGLMAEASASNRANLQRILAIAHRAEDPPSGGVPPEALDVARTIVRRGIEPDAIFQGYRRGQQIALEHWIAATGEIVEPGEELIRVTQFSLRLASAYVDETLRRVLEEVQREREAVLGGALARRSETIRLLLDGAPLDSAAAGARLGYDLARRHTALIVWAESPGVPAGALEQAATALAHAAGARRPLTLSVGASTLWAWIACEGEPAAEELRLALEHVPAGTRAAVGPNRSGVAGFRSSHEAAQAVHGLLAGRPEAERLATYGELEVTTLAAHDRERAREFMLATLGDLAQDGPSAERLRETLRVYLEEAENAPRAARRLQTHRNTVLQRVARASEVLGRRPGDGRLALELALELRRRLGAPAQPKNSSAVS